MFSLLQFVLHMLFFLLCTGGSAIVSNFNTVSVHHGSEVLLCHTRELDPVNVPGLLLC